MVFEGRKWTTSHIYHISFKLRSTATPRAEEKYNTTFKEIQMNVGLRQVGNVVQVWEEFQGREDGDGEVRIGRRPKCFDQPLGKESN